MNFELKEYRKNLLHQLTDRNKREGYIYQDIIKDYKLLFGKYKAIVEKNIQLDREILSLKSFPR